MMMLWRDDILIHVHFPNVINSLKVAKSIVLGDSGVGKTCLVNRCVSCYMQLAPVYFRIKIKVHCTVKP